MQSELEGTPAAAIWRPRSTAGVTLGATPLGVSETAVGGSAIEAVPLADPSGTGVAGG